MKTISPATVTIGVMAIVFGLVGAYFARQAMKPQHLPELRAPAAPRATGPTVVVARVNLPENTRIGSRDVRVMTLAAGRERPEGALRTIEEAVGRLTREPIRANKMVEDGLLYEVGERPSPADLIPPGHVALTIDATGATADGLVRMGSRVDVALTIEGDHPDLGGIRTQTLLQNVLVLNTGDEELELPSPSATARERRAVRPDPRAANRVTVAVTPEQANDLITAQKAGMLSVSLNSFDGVAPSDDKPQRTLRELLALRDPPVVVEETPLPELPPEESKPFTVEKWNGSTRQVIELSNSAVREARDASAADARRHGRSQPIPTSLEDAN